MDRISKPQNTNKFQYNDGGRKAAGYKGTTGDCVVRAISIATGFSYQKVYDDLNGLIKSEKQTKKAKKSSSRTGVYRRFYEKYLKSVGFKWVPTMKIGEGCKVHLDKDELPKGIIIARLSKHICAVVDGVVQDTHDPSRGGTRCVYGYYVKDEKMDKRFN